MTEEQPNDSSYKQLCWILQNDAHVDVSLVRHIFRGEPSDHCRPLCAGASCVAQLRAISGGTAGRRHRHDELLP